MTLTLVASAALTSACGRISFEETPVADSGPSPDTGVVDSGVVDSGAPADSGTVLDSGPADSGTTAPDSTVVDAGWRDPVFVDTGAFPFAIASDDAAVYWGDWSDGSLHRIPFTAGAPTELIPSGVVSIGHGLAVRNGQVYFCDRATGELQRMPTAGGAIEPLAVSPCFDLVVDDTHLYWSNSDPTEPAIRRLALVGGAPEDVGGVGVANNLAMQGGDLYWTAYGPGTIFTMPKTGGAHTELATVRPGGPWGITADDTHVYWADHHTDTGGVSRVPVGGGPVEVLATDQNGPHSVDLDGTTLYWTNDFGDTIMSVVPGSAPVAVATGQDRPKDLVVTPGGLYWTTRGGAVVQLPR